MCEYCPATGAGDCFWCAMVEAEARKPETVKVAEEYRLQELVTDQHSVEAIREALDRRRITANYKPWTSELKANAYGRLKLDSESHLATLNNVPLDLSPIEFALLYLLLRSTGRAFSRTYLLDTVWGETYIGGDRSVDNTILRLRKKLGLLGEAIETVWGIGYRLRPERQ